MLVRLLEDGWFYISAGGFLASLVLFAFLLGQYRVAVEAADEDEDENPDLPEIRADSAPKNPSALQPEVSPLAPREKTLAAATILTADDLPVSRPGLPRVSVQEESVAMKSQQQTARDPAMEDRIAKKLNEGFAGLLEELKGLSKNTQHFVEEIKEMENLFSKQSRRNEEIYGYLSGLVVAQAPRATSNPEAEKEKWLKAEAPPLVFKPEKIAGPEPIAIHLAAAPGPLKETSPSRDGSPASEPPRRLDEATIVLKPTTASGVRAAAPQVADRPPEAEDPAAEEPPREIPIRKGPVWPI